MVWDQLFMDSFSTYSMWNLKNCQWQEQIWEQTQAHSTISNRYFFIHLIKMQFIWLGWKMNGFWSPRLLCEIILDLQHLKTKAEGTVFPCIPLFEIGRTYLSPRQFKNYQTVLVHDVTPHGMVNSHRCVPLFPRGCVCCTRSPGEAAFCSKWQLGADSHLCSPVCCTFPPYNWKH